jgi:NADH-ubiquinone oxidoreductase chain 1
LAEAESELVSGFMTEHAAVIFVFFFLAEYASIVLICILNTILFLGGYLLDFNLLLYILDYIPMLYSTQVENVTQEEIFGNFFSPIIEGILYGLTLGVKSCVMIFIFI